MSKQTMNTRRLVYVAVFAALLVIGAQVAIPFPGGVPLTLQTFSVAFAGAFLGRRDGLLAIGVYVALGAVGLPVFAGMKGGLQVLVGPTGGFIFGFFILAYAMAVAVETESIPLKVLYALGGLLACHALGVLMFVFVTHNPIGASLLMVSVPFLWKDALSLAVALVLAKAVRQRLPQMTPVK